MPQDMTMPTGAVPPATAAPQAATTPADLPNLMGATAPAAPTDQAAFDPAAAMADLQAGKAELDQRDAAIDKAKTVSENETEAMRQQILGTLFDLLKKAGVDPSDENSTQQFLDGIKDSDPDLYELFDFAFSNLVGEQPTTQPPEMSGDFVPEEGAGDMPPQGAAPSGPQDLKNLTAALG